MPKFLTITATAKLLGVSEWRVRYAIDHLGVEVPRCGPSRMVPTDWLPAIRDRLNNVDRRKKAKRPRLRLTD